jgi:hypothetical protein
LRDVIYSNAGRFIVTRCSFASVILQTNFLFSSEAWHADKNLGKYEKSALPQEVDIPSEAKSTVLSMETGNKRCKLLRHVSFIGRQRIGGRVVFMAPAVLVRDVKQQVTAPPSLSSSDMVVLFKVAG